MFYTYAEKQGNIFFEGWQMRQIAFDTLRRYLYYSEYVSPDKVAYPNAHDNPLPIAEASDHPIAETGDFGTNSEGGVGGQAAAHLTGRPRVLPAHRQPQFSEVPPSPRNSDEVRWRKKMKVDMIVVVGREHEFLLGDTHLRETDLFQVEIHGETRPLALGERPSPGPLLCASAGLSGMPARCSVENDEYICDPFFLRELYEALRDQFANLRMERELSEMSSGQQLLPSSARKTQTIESPRPKNGSAHRSSRIKLIFRMRNDYEYRRFIYVVQTVLGYDKLSVRPYRGLPPYDPRNGVIFAMIPMCVWHTFKQLDKTVFYSFLRGDVVGRDASGELCVALRGAYLCITHDTVLVMRDTGNIPRWIKLPQPPVFGSDAIRRFSPSVEVLRLRHVIHETCFASLEIRRVINIQEIPEMSVRSFVARYERVSGRAIDFDPARGYAGVLSCPLPKEQLAQVWREVQDIYAARDPSVVSRAAIPLYRNNANDTELTAEQLETLARRLARERSSRDDIVGLPYEEASRIQAPPRRDSVPHNSRHAGTSHTSLGAPTQRHNDATGLQVVPSPNRADVGRRSSESTPATPSDHQRSSTVTGEGVVHHHHRRNSECTASVNSRAAVVPSRGFNAVGTTSPSSLMLSDTSSTGNPFPAMPASGSTNGNTRRFTGATVPNYSNPPASASAGRATFSSPHVERAQLPSDRLETPQLASSPGVGASGFGQSAVPMGVSPGFMNTSFSSAQVGGNSVQYQLPGARYLSADEVHGAGSWVAVDQHTVLMCESAHSGEDVVHAVYANAELNVSEIVSKSITAMQATTGLTRKLSDSAGQLVVSRRGSGDTTTQASASSPTLWLESSRSKRVQTTVFSVET